MKKKGYAFSISVALVTVSMFLIIYIGSVVGRSFKIDFTQEKLYSLSPGTKKILSKLNTPLTMKLYYSKTAANKGTEGIRVFNNYFSYVRDLLNEFAQNSGNNLVLEVIDPRPNSEDEEDASFYGLKKFQLTNTETYFFGLVVKSESGGEKVIEFFDPSKQENLEYDIAKTIYSVTHPNKKKLGILSSLPVLNENMSPYMAQMMRMQGRSAPKSWIFTNALKEFFEVKKIDKDVEKIEGVDILMVVHPQNFSDKVNFAIDQFVLKGGRVMLFVTPHLANNNDPAAQMGGGMSKSNLKTLLNNWGVDLKDGEFAGDNLLAGQGQVNRYSPPVKLLPLVKCDERCLAHTEDTISKGLNNLLFLFPGALTKLDEKNENVTPILTTTDKGNSYKAAAYELRNPGQLTKNFTEGKEPVVLAYKITGKFKTAYPNGVTFEEKAEGENKDAKGKKKTLTGIKESEKESAIVVFSDVDFITDAMAFRETFLGVGVANDNLALVMNAAENLTGSTDLIAIRSKGKFSRTFDLLDKIEAKAEDATADKVKSINNEIQSFKNDLEQLSKSANSENIGLLQNKGLQKRKELEKNIYALNKELRKVKREGREEIEKIGRNLQFINTLWIPVVLLIIGLVTSYLRGEQRKSYALKNLGEKSHG